MFLNYPPIFWVTAVVAVLLLGIAKAGFGGGLGFLVTPLVALTIPVSEAAALLLPLFIFTDLLTLRQYRLNYDRPSISLMLPSAIIGIVTGALLFSTLSHNDRLMQIGIGLLSLIFLAYQLYQVQILGVFEAHRPPRAAGILLSATAGFTSTLAHAGGPLATMYLLPQQFPRQIFVGTMILFFTIVNLIKLIPYSFLGLLNVGNLAVVVILAPLCFVGVKLGVYLNGRFTDKWFNRVIYIVLFLTSIQLIRG